MINPVTFSGIPVFGSGAVKVQPPSPLPYVDGYLAGAILPAQHLNWFMANLIGDDLLSSDALNHLIAELGNLVTGSGAAIAPGDDTQVMTAMKQFLSGYTLLTSGSPYTLVADYSKTLIIIATANPYIVNLPQASTCLGFRVRIINGSSAITGLIQVHPFTGDAIGPTGINIDCYLQNVDQSGATGLYQSIELVAAVSGYWDVVAGQFSPYQVTDTNGAQYHLGKLHHLPMANTINRTIFNGNPVAGPWSTAKSGIVYGVPIGAKAIRARVDLIAAATAAGQVRFIQAFSDNNSFAPGAGTSHPNNIAAFKAVGAGDYIETTVEVDIPLNSSGNLYIFSTALTNVAMASSAVTIVAVGYYMGD